jgi:hypothetical protein
MLNTNSVPGICKHLKLTGKLYNYMEIAKIHLCLWREFRGSNGNDIETKRNDASIIGVF